MYELIVLGLVPGTQIQINFEMWLRIAGVCAILFAWWRIHRVHLIRNTFITGYLAVETRRKMASLESGSNNSLLTN
jgi:hypothetical protein